jgi:hypothetical protein
LRFFLIELKEVTWARGICEGKSIDDVIINKLMDNRKIDQWAVQRVFA